MKRPNERAVLLGLGVVALVAFLVVALNKSGDGDKGDSSQPGSQVESAQTGATNSKPESKASAPEIPVIKVIEGEPMKGILDLTYNQGERVRFKVHSDTAEEVHLHGYDISKGVKPGGTVTFDFPAEIEGIFEVELEQSAVQIAELTVEP